MANPSRLCFAKKWRQSPEAHLRVAFKALDDASSRSETAPTDFLCKAGAADAGHLVARLSTRNQREEIPHWAANRLSIRRPAAAISAANVLKEIGS